MKSCSSTPPTAKIAIASTTPATAAAVVPAGSKTSILLDRRALVAAYPELAFSGGAGARVRLTYQEALVGDGFRKGNRDEIEGKRMIGLSDEVLRRNRRGHDVADARHALARLRGAGGVGCAARCAQTLRLQVLYDARGFERSAFLCASLGE